MVCEDPDRAKPERLIFIVGAVAAALAGGYFVRLLMSD
jgi:hypothetical protein